MRKKTSSLLVLVALFVTFVFAGCAVSRKVQYDRLNLNLPEVKTESVSIATWDQRSQILDGSRKPDFVGYMRSGAGIAYPMGTKSGKPFTDDLSTTIAEAFNEEGCSTSIIKTTYDQEEDAIIDNLLSSGNERLILLKLDKLYTDGYGVQVLNYDMQLSIYDASGELMASESNEGNNEIGGNAFWGPGDYKQYMPTALKIILENMFSDSSIKEAL